MEKKNEKSKWLMIFLFGMIVGIVASFIYQSFNVYEMAPAPMPKEGILIAQQHISSYFS